MLCRITWCLVQRLSYTYPAWGLCVARFDRQGNAKASEREASDSIRVNGYSLWTRGKFYEYKVDNLNIKKGISLTPLN